MRARLLGLLFVLALASPAHAGDRRVVPLDRLLPEIHRHNPGTFYDADGPYPGADGELHYRVKWMMPNGRVVWFDVDAHDGRVLNGVAMPPPRIALPPPRFRGGGYPASGNRGWPARNNDRGRRGHP
jgi:hypothetical protein